MSEIKHTFEKNVLKVIVSEEATAAEFSAINDLLRKHQGLKKLSIDMYQCEYIQSKILAELVALKKISVKEKFDIELLNISDSIAQILEMTNMQAIFNIRDDYASYPMEVLFDKFLDTVAAQDVSNFLAGNYNEEIKNKLIALIEEGDPVKTEYAILTMGRAQDFGSIEIFRKALSNPFNNIKIAAILAIGWLGDTKSKDGLYFYLVNKDSDLAEAASASIALLSDAMDSEKLDIYLNHENFKVRMMAARSLTLINDDKGYTFIVKRLEKETNEQVRVALAKCLSFFNIEGVGNLLVNLLDDSSIPVREAAASGLVRIGVGKYANIILEKVSDKDSWVGFFAAKALAGSRDLGIIAKLQQVYDSVELNVKLAIIEVLGKCGCTNQDFFISKLSDHNEDIRKEALNALAELKSTEALEAAMKLYNSDANWIVRYKAVEIILCMKPDGYEDLLKKRLDSEDNRYIKEKIIGAIGE